jgi:hypothetical protein
MLEDLRAIAIEHHGFSDDAAVSRVVRKALETRLEWLRREGEAGTAVEEPVALMLIMQSSVPCLDRSISSFDLTSLWRSTRSEISTKS